MGDLDNDGDVDAVVFNANGSARVLINRAAAARWIGLRLLTGKRDALGARVEVVLSSGQSRWRRARSDASYLSANDPRVLVGLGSRDAVEVVRVFWPDGRREQWSGLPLGRYSTLVQGRGRPLPAPS